MLKNFACRSSRPFPGTAEGRWLWTILCVPALLSGARIERAAAYHPMDPVDKVYSTGINTSNADLGRKRHNIGLLDIMITNLGIIGNPGRGFVPQESAAAWKGDEYLYAASMWIGAVASDNLPYVSTGAYEFELRPSLAEVDHIYSSYEGTADGNRLGFSTRPDDDADGIVDEDPLNGKDDDRDGRIDEDYSAISQQMFTCEYWDYTEEARNSYPEHRPLYVKIRQQSYAWSTEGANEFVGFDFNIVNDGFEVLRQVYLGFFVDSDIGTKGVDGYFTDDGGAYYATDTTFADPSIDFQCADGPSGETKFCRNQTLSLNICYMFDVPDDGERAKGGDVDGFFGGMFLGHTTDPSGQTAPARVTVHTARFFNGSNPYPQGDPTNDAERYDLLSVGTKPSRPTGQPDDYRYCFSAGPFREMAPDDVLQLQVAFVVGTGKSGMLTNAVAAQRIYDGRWRDTDGDPGGVRTGWDGKETCLRSLQPGEPLTWKDPCDTLNPTSLTIKEDYCTPEHYVDNDCNCCTPLFPTQTEATTGLGLDMLIHWVGTVAPPAPATNIDNQDSVTVFVAAGDRSVLVAWDNLSELTADPIEKRILFTGYKVWRVEGWSRPVGSAGPAPTDWQLVADLSDRPADSLGTESLYYLRRPLSGPAPHYQFPTADSTGPVPTGSADSTEAYKWQYPVGRYAFRDTVGLKNGMIYFYDVTAYAAWEDAATGQPKGLEGRPTATSRDAIYPRWSVSRAADLAEVCVVPNPYIRGRNPAGWDLTPSTVDPTGTKLAFVGLPDEPCTVKIFTLAGDLVRTLDSRAGGESRNAGAVFWDLISRNGQDSVAGVYIYLVECGGKSRIGRFVVVR